MESVVLVIHLILALAIIILVLLQRSEGGGLGIGGGGGGLGGFASARGTANALTKMTGLCAAGFFVTSLTLGYLATHNGNISSGILENVNDVEIQAPVATDDVSAPEAGVVYIPPSDIEEPQNDIPEIDVQKTPDESEVGTSPDEMNGASNNAVQSVKDSVDETEGEFERKIKE